MTEKPKLFEIFITTLIMFERKTARFQSNQRTTKRLLTKEIIIKRSINEAWKSVAVGRDAGVAVTADMIWLCIATCFLIALQPYKGEQRSLPKGAASGLLLAAWGSLWDPQPKLPGSVGIFPLLCMLAGSEEQHEQQLGWKDTRDMRIRVYGVTKGKEAWNPSVLNRGRGR